MPRRRATQRGFPARATRLTAWAIGPEGATAHSASNAQLMPTGVIPNIEALTIIRIRGTFLFFLTSVSSVSDGFLGAVGIGIVTDEAFTAGIGSMPTPLSDDEDELWMWHSFFHAIAVSTTNIDRQMTTQIRLPIDSKAMRKFEPGNTLFAAVEVTETGTAVGQAHLLTWTLIKLP